MACKENEVWYAPTNTCAATTYKMDEKKYDGSGSVWGYIPQSLPGIAQIISSLKGNAQPQNVTYVSQTPTTNPFSGGSSTIWIVLAVVALIIVLVVAFKNGGGK